VFLDVSAYRISVLYVKMDERGLAQRSDELVEFVGFGDPGRRTLELFRRVSVKAWAGGTPSRCRNCSSSDSIPAVSRMSANHAF
jgi:hypothetical protein